MKYLNILTYMLIFFWSLLFEIYINNKISKSQEEGEHLWISAVTFENCLKFLVWKTSCECNPPSVIQVFENIVLALRFVCCYFKIIFGLPFFLSELFYLVVCIVCCYFQMYFAISLRRPLGFPSVLNNFTKVSLRNFMCWHFKKTSGWKFKKGLVKVSLSNFAHIAIKLFHEVRFWGEDHVV